MFSLFFFFFFLFLFSFEKGRRRRVTKGVEEWSGVFLHSAPLSHRISIHCVGRRKKKQQKQSPPFFLISNFKFILLPSLKFPPRIHQSTTRTRNKHPLLLPSFLICKLAPLLLLLLLLRVSWSLSIGRYAHPARLRRFRHFRKEKEKKAAAAAATADIASFC